MKAFIVLQLELVTPGFISPHCRWCIGAVLGLLLSSEVSGGHINPAVTVALATLGKFPWR